MRVVVNGKKFNSAEYSRMSRRTSDIVLYNRSIGKIESFEVDISSNLVFALINQFEIEQDSTYFKAGRRLVRQTEKYAIVPVDQLTGILVLSRCFENLFYVCKKKKKKQSQTCYFQVKFSPGMFTYFVSRILLFLLKPYITVHYSS